MDSVAGRRIFPGGPALTEGHKCTRVAPYGKPDMLKMFALLPSSRWTHTYSLFVSMGAAMGCPDPRCAVPFHAILTQKTPYLPKTQAKARLHCDRALPAVPPSLRHFPLVHRPPALLLANIQLPGQRPLALDGCNRPRS